MSALFLSRPAATVFQTTVVLTGVAALALWPPRDGVMMLVALDGRDAGRMVAPALDAGAMLTGRGPFANSLIVQGVRARLTPLARHGLILVAAPSGLCGTDIAA